MQITEKIFDSDVSERADVFVALAADVSRSRAAQLIDQNMVTANGKAVTKKTKLSRGMRVKIILPEPEAYTVEAQDIPLDIVFEDNDLLVVNKPKGMVVHPAPGNLEGTLVNALLFHCGKSLSGINGVMRPGIVHRIDKNTSGLLMVAKNDLAHNHLARQIGEHTFTREYAAVVYGKMKEPAGTVSAPISRHPAKRKQMAIVKDGREAVTHYETVEELNGFTYLKLKLETGRTHQIRVHMAYIGHPVAGDDVYGPRKVIEKLGGQCLHAQKLGFVHPRSNEYMEFEAPLPDYFEDFLKEKRLYDGDF